MRSLFNKVFRNIFWHGYIQTSVRVNIIQNIADILDSYLKVGFVHGRVFHPYQKRDIALIICS